MTKLENKLTCVSAAKNGNLKDLKLARNNGCPWSEYNMAVAAKRLLYFEDIVKYRSIFSPNTFSRCYAPWQLRC